MHYCILAGNALLKRTGNACCLVQPGSCSPSSTPIVTLHDRVCAAAAAGYVPSKQLRCHRVYCPIHPHQGVTPASSRVLTLQVVQLHRLEAQCLLLHFEHCDLAGCAMVVLQQHPDGWLWHRAVGLRCALTRPEAGPVAMYRYAAAACMEHLRALTCCTHRLCVGLCRKHMEHR